MPSLLSINFNEGGGGGGGGGGRGRGEGVCWHIYLNASRKGSARLSLRQEDMGMRQLPGLNLGSYLDWLCPWNHHECVLCCYFFSLDVWVYVYDIIINSFPAKF